MTIEQLPLAKQVEIVFREIQDELFQLTSGIIFMQIRDNVIGKFGARHNPLESKGGLFQVSGSGLTEAHLRSFRQMAIESLRHKTSWTHGEISFEFAIKQGTLCASVQFESNYNMANFLLKRKGLHELY
ncbi:O-methyltransferase [Paenibacillus psychroresistens]|uniref:O-methyltransferase n=1 Tax=Paenibacillus psychroresistens TaxID=1778678 RepID=A0A6B8RF38_9BACL|nr:O-methyltransferase [Paenibacillus psychroresistens]QGQ94800.1 O-methyltransferase [Paenibacillus psychroresistens]